MSHIVTIQTQVRDPAAIGNACRREQLPEPVFGTFEVFSTSATGWKVQLPEWNCPVVCDVEQGQVYYDNFGGRWGEQRHLDLFLQIYAVEKSTRPQCPP